ncbi:hypothetical protein [Streptomyces zagrosensis]|uniref:Secreted protein n=1 Tax=Streptomyces zagrosensis TaxID=1042984 RepID=A0A7W9QF61_9ACTN|nr:hypothetical protein [Streptomyces zagrosensis]MBB5939145.1 hypothetical protein [Streptomyces zagrosensis]
MSATSLAVLLAAGIATAVGVAALHTTRGLRRQIAALRTEVVAAAAAGTEAAAACVPAARQAPAAEIRAAIADALAEERERELAEARAFWAAQEARDTVTGSDGSALLGGLAGLGDEPLTDPTPYVPRQSDFAGLEPVLDSELLDAALDAAFDPALDPMLDPALDLVGEPEGPEAAELAAARRRHPSHPSHAAKDAAQQSAIIGHERTVTLLDELAQSHTPLADVRPGPLGTLDVYVFADGTTVCMTPGHRETADQLARALQDGDAPVLLGGSGVSGAYTLTFGYGDRCVYVLADRVIASL